MLAGYVSQEFPDIHTGWLTALKFFVLFVTVAINIKGPLSLLLLPSVGLALQSCFVHMLFVLV